jgi:hypothetical protein
VTDHQQLRSAAAGQPPLTGRLEPWLAELLADPATCAGLLERFGSPVNVIDPAPLVRNAAELVAAGAARGVEVRVRFARKANKALALVDAALAAGHGVDVASLAELAQVLQAGAPPERVILSAAGSPARSTPCPNSRPWLGSPGPPDEWRPSHPDWRRNPAATSPPPGSANWQRAGAKRSAPDRSKGWRSSVSTSTWAATGPPTASPRSPNASTSWTS